MQMQTLPNAGRRKARILTTVAGVSVLALGAAVAQQAARAWDINQITSNFGQSASTLSYGSNSSQITVSGDVRTIATNSVASHRVGAGNRNSPQAINAVYRVDATPNKTGRTTPTSIQQKFGVTITGIIFDAYAAEWFGGNRSGWNYSVPGGAIPLGIDTNNGHVQPTGMYHHHGMPIDLMTQLGWREGAHSPLIGYAADGFPIYALTGQNGQFQTSGYVLKNGSRPSGGANPGGTYDGTFHDDWQYRSGAGSLDECNGTTTYNSSYPSGTYAYFLTESYPVIPACLKGAASSDFTNTGGGGGGGAAGTSNGQRPQRGDGNGPRPPKRG